MYIHYVCVWQHQYIGSSNFFHYKVHVYQEIGQISSKSILFCLATALAKLQHHHLCLIDQFAVHKKEFLYHSNVSIFQLFHALFRQYKSDLLHCFFTKIFCMCCSQNLKNCISIHRITDQMFIL